MIIAAHWKMREYLSEFKGGAARLPVLMALTLHANARLRCWPSTTLLCKETGFNKKTVVEARQWLVERKAIQLVPYDKREGLEKKLPQRQFVYQLTGMMQTAIGLQPYLNMTPETEAADRSELSEGVTDTPLTPDEPSKGVNGTPFKGVGSESSLGTPKGIKAFKDSTIEDKELDNAPTAVVGGEVPTPDTPVQEPPTDEPAPRPAPERPRNPTFDAIVQDGYGVALDDPAGIASVAKTAGWFASWCDGNEVKAGPRKKDGVIPGASPPMQGAELLAFLGEYHKKGIDFPQNVLAFVRYASEYRAQHRRAPSGNGHVNPLKDAHKRADPNCPHCHGNGQLAGPNGKSVLCECTKAVRDVA